MPFWANEAIFQAFWELGYLDQSCIWRRLFDADKALSCLEFGHTKLKKSESGLDKNFEMVYIVMMRSGREFCWWISTYLSYFQN